MFRRLVAGSLMLPFVLTGCAHHDDTFATHGSVGFGQTIVVEEGAAEGTTTPVPVAWGTTEVIGHIHGPRAVAAEDGPYLLDSGDKLRVFVYGQPSLSRLYTVDHEGRISVPLIGHVHARGNTTAGLEKVIRSRLGAQYVKDPHVTVDIQQNRPFFILGEVRSAGQYPYVSGMTIQSAIAIAGGFSERANERKFQITRRINGLVEKLDVPDDYVVLPGDTIQVYERFF